MNIRNFVDALHCLYWQGGCTSKDVGVATKGFKAGRNRNLGGTCLTPPRFQVSPATEDFGGSAECSVPKWAAVWNVNACHQQAAGCCVQPFYQ